ncbi:MAG: PadR family transcriptional regulator [Coriobacteriia bacterium]|nr:PadR family transcriptional regulator [Coriobacteriia bacterium]
MHGHYFKEESCGGSVRGHHPDGHRGFKMPFGGMHHGFGGPHGARARRGDIRPAILRLLSEQAMHGYQIIQELSTRSGGAWSPSAGSVYPTLQLLADEGLVTAEETAGKKVFSLTDAGKAMVAETADQPAPWEEVAQGDSGIGDYREAAGKFMAAAFQVGKNGTKDQRETALKVLDEARKKLYAILAEG